MVCDIAGLEDALPRRELPDLNLGSQDRGFVVIKKLEEWNVA
jgi:hypothetical protein